MSADIHPGAAPRVSVVMTVRNGLRYMDLAIGSITSQTFTDWEMLIVDDASSDATPEQLREWARRDRRIRTFRLPPTGIAGARNFAHTHARGELIAVMDADDIARPTRFAQQTAYLDRNPDCIAVGSDVLVIDEDGDPIGERRWFRSHDEINRALLDGRGDAMTHPVVMMRKSVVEEIGGYDARMGQIVHDLDLFLRLAEVGRLHNLPQVLLDYRRHFQSVSLNPTDGSGRYYGEVMRETFERRGVQRDVKKVNRPKAQDFAAQTAEWVRWAHRAGNERTAAKWAKRMITDAPTDPRTYKLVIGSYFPRATRAARWIKSKV